MNLTDAQKSAVADWVEGGAELGDIQSRLKDEFGVTLTYLDTRFLLGDLGLELLSEREEEEVEAPAEAEAAPGPEGGELPDGDSGGGLEDTPPAPPEDDPLAGSGKVSVTVDALTQPHTMVSGRVTFGDGKGAAWYIDQMGRLGYDPDEAGYRPSEADLAEFQMELQGALRGQGF